MVDFSALAVPGVRALRPYEPGKPVATLERELGIRDAVKLASNENPLGPSPRALAAIHAVLGELHIYPDGSSFALRQALADRHGMVPEQITLGNGSNEILELVARTWLAPGRNAVFSEHAFAVYPLVVQAVSAEGRAAGALPMDSGQPFGHDLDAMLARLDANTRVVFVANPNNPTGTWVSAEALEEFLSQVPAETLVVVDEAYAEYVEAKDAESVRVNREGLVQVAAGLRERSLNFIPSVGNFITFDVRQPPGPVYEQLLHQGVIVRPVPNYGLPTHLRVTIGTRDQNDRFLGALDHVLTA
ncbi:MAG: aminotransferase class I/II-fold pyridoxal phosphate-dependent enzyme [Thioalkalivibrio sp.]|nr:aminotransferase class I/II-fold pyridoxal phosphate-dependent enzyme [Thioalkalivibrio sp.]